MIGRAGLLWLTLAGAAGAVDLSLPPAARQTVERNTAPDSFTAPVSVFENGSTRTVTVEGDVARAAWRIDAGGLTPLQVLRPLRSQLETAGYTIALDCSASDCGGFDFRFSIEVLPGPNMYVNIRDYHFATAVLGPPDKPAGVVTILASTTASSAYVQIIQAGAQDADVAATPTQGTPAPTDVALGDDLIAKLQDKGRVVLGGLNFDTGTSGLGQEGQSSLTTLATFLDAQPKMRIVLVGHTDTVGDLQPNIALSRERAGSVRMRLIDEYGVNPSQIQAEGVGYLAPIASNLTAQGREANRRVEVVLLAAPGQD